MSLKSRQVGQTKSIVLSGTPIDLVTITESNSVGTPRSNVVAFLQNAHLTDWVSTAEIWRPVGLGVSCTITFADAEAGLTLQKAAAAVDQSAGFAAASSGGVATTGILVAVSSQYCPFTSYVSSAGASLFTADAAGDSWRVAVSTAPDTTGSANLQLHYANIDVAGISDAVTTL